MQMFSFMFGKMHDEVALHAGCIHALEVYLLSHLLSKYIYHLFFIFVLVTDYFFCFDRWKEGYACPEKLEMG